MTWNKVKIESTLDELEDKITKISQEPLLSALKYDYETLLYILKIIDENSYKDYRAKVPRSKINLTTYYESFLKESFESLLSHRDDILDLSISADKIRLYHPNKYRKKTITTEKYYEMTRSFFANFDQEHYNLFDESYIYFTQERATLGYSTGACFNTISVKDLYILTSDKMTTLPHEVGHSYEKSKITDISQKVSFAYSSFCESYPRFMEYAFLDYYKDSEYKDFFLECKRELFEQLKDCVEFYLPVIFSITGFSIPCSRFTLKDGKTAHKRIYDYVIAEFVAIYMFHLYKCDRKLFDEFIKKYHSFLGVSDAKIWELLDMNDMIDAFNDEVIELNRALRLSRKKEKQGLFNIFKK